MRTVYQELRDVKANELKLEDGGQALILDDLGGKELVGDGCLFVRIQSWDDKECKHPLMNDLVGKKIRITIEVED